MPKSKFPKTIYVKREALGDDEDFLAAYESLQGTVDADNEEEMAIYELVKRIKVVAPTRIKE